jgi:hypothetical protein
MLIFQVSQSVGCLPAIPVYFQDYRSVYAMSTAPVSSHTIIIKASTLAAMTPDRRDLRIFTQVSSVVNNKEFLEFSFTENSFSMSFLVGKRGGEEGDWLVNARFIRRRHFTWKMCAKQLLTEKKSKNLLKRHPPN